MKKQLTTIFAAFLSFTAFSQNKDITVSSGILLNGYSGSVMYRKYNKDMTSAKRYSISNFSINNDYENMIPDKEISNKNAIDNKLKRKTYNSFLMSGSYGKQKNLKNIENIQFYQGNQLSFLIRYYQLHSSYINIAYNSSNDNYTAVSGSLSNEKYYNINPFIGKFIGAQYKIIKNFYVSAEVYLGIGYWVEINKSKDYYYTINNDRTVENEKEFNNHKPKIKSILYFNNGANLMLSYRFGKIR